MRKEKLEVTLVEASPRLMDAVHMTALGFVREESKALAEDVSMHLQGGQIIYRIFVGECEVGFAIFVVYGDILYLSGVILIPEYQGKGIINQVVKVVGSIQTECRYLILRTQSLRMYLAASRLCTQFYPQLGVWQNIPEEFTQRGNLVAEKINSQFPVHYGCYGGPLYGAKPVHRDDQLQQSWDELCNFERGDAIIFVGSLR